MGCITFYFYDKLQKNFEKINFSKDCVRGICLQRSVGKQMKSGPKAKLNSLNKLRLKRKICNLKHICEKVNCKKLINSSDISVSCHTVVRTLSSKV